MIEARRQSRADYWSADYIIREMIDKGGGNTYAVNLILIDK